MISFGAQFLGEVRGNDDKEAPPISGGGVIQINAGLGFGDLFNPYGQRGAPDLWSVGPVLRGGFDSDGSETWPFVSGGLRLSYTRAVDGNLVTPAFEVGHRFNGGTSEDAPYLGAELGVGFGAASFLGPVVGVSIDPTTAVRKVPFTDGATAYAGLKAFF